MDGAGCECSAALGVLASARDAAVVRLAAIDERLDDDGVVSEHVNGLGTVCVDADAMVAVAVGCTTSFAQDLVEQAVTRVVRVPNLHASMLDGTVDDYRSRCVAGELGDVPVELARTMVDVLGADLGTMSGPALRRRTRHGPVPALSGSVAGADQGGAQGDRVATVGG